MDKCCRFLNRLVGIAAIFYMVCGSSHAAFSLSAELATNAAKDGGVAFADYNNDTCPDVLVTTSTAQSPLLYTQNVSGGLCVGTFVLSRSFNENTPRSIVWGDFNNDGFVDFASNTNNKLVVYQNVDGTAAGFVNIASFNPGNVEGIGWLDYDADGDLDLFVENQTFGLRIYLNVANTLTAGQFFDIHSDAVAESDYSAVADYDIDGDVDIYARRGGILDTNAEADLFINSGLGGTIAAGSVGAAFNRESDPDINYDGPNIDKGGVAFCDLDGDGDLDIVRTNGGPSRIYERTPIGWTPQTNFGGDNEGVACADVDNDGDEDVIFNTGVGNAVLYRNDGGFIFTLDNMGITANGEGKGLAFTDFDRDGDMDVLFNITNVANELWVNDTNDTNYLIVRPMVSGRAALGATVQLFSCSASGAIGSAILGSRDISGGSGRGSQNESIAHFGLSAVGGANTAYVARTTFVGGNVVDRAVRPDMLGTYQSIVVSTTDSNDLNACLDNDNDGVSDIADADDDNDGIPDITEGSGDPDGDGLINSFDIDSDGDGIVDNIEAQAEGGYQAPLGSDTDNDGLDDRYDTDNGGAAIVIVNTDSADNPDYLDDDSDNDGIDDLIEGHDANGNGVADVIPAGGSADADGDGLNDNFDTFVGPGSGNAIGSNAPIQNTDGVDNRDWRDTDDDNDTALTLVEGGIGNDADGNGTPDYLDSSAFDADSDGVSDQNDPDDANPCIPSQFGSGCTVDTDGDGIFDVVEGEFTDTDADGVRDYLESVVLDADGDGVNNQLDAANLDSCNPNFPSSTCLDSDNDGVADFGTSTTSVSVESSLGANTNPCAPSNTVAVCDSDNDGISDGEELTNNTDPNLGDSDGDGIPDGVENTDADGDGVNDGADTDADNDGIPDATEAGSNPSIPVDSDGDGRADFIDPDADNDGIPDSIEDVVDTDSDGVANYLDPDSDGDGIPDTVEDDVARGLDTDNDGIDDGYDIDSSTSSVDANGDGVADTFTPKDSDGDGAADYLDSDSDNDGISDTIEADVDLLADIDVDQINDIYDVDATLGLDVNNDGVDDAINPTNTDADGVPDYLDLDTDNDALFDVIEAGGLDQNADGIIDDLANSEGSILLPTDTDGDGIGDWREIDSDNDGVYDIVGSGFAALDADGDGRVDDLSDSDNDGIADVYDQTIGFGGASDADKDGISDSLEGTGDFDADGIPDYLDTDSDNDGIPDVQEIDTISGGLIDTDGDGMPNYIDFDSDNDGISDELEGAEDLNNNGIPDYIDSEGTLKTAVSGSSSVWFLVLLICFTSVRFRRTITAMAPVFASLICLSALLLQIPVVHAASLCGNSIFPENLRDYQEGKDSERDVAEYQSCWYVGGGLGYSYLSPQGEANNFFLDSRRNNDIGYHFFLGKQFSPSWFAEFKYVDMGEAGITNRNLAIAAAFPRAAITYKVPSLMAGYQLQATQNWILFLKTGIASIMNDVTGGPVPFEKQSTVQLGIGSGTQYNFARSQWFVRGDFDWYDRDAWYAGISVGMQFGHRVAILKSSSSLVDSDGDNVSDAFDHCPHTSQNESVAENGCALDSDRDGVSDAFDHCPHTSQNESVTQNGCSLEKDSDQDGVVDEADVCPRTPAGAEVDLKGCALKVEVQFPDLRFDSNSARLKTDMKSMLNSEAQTLINNPELNIEVAGYADSRGSVNYNRWLSALRAEAVRNYLIDQGVSAERLKAVAYGESNPEADNNTHEGRAQNRRVILQVAFDHCPNTLEGKSLTEKRCLLDTDSDQDGIVDEEDICPQTLLGTEVDLKGCVLKTEVQFPDLRFETNSARLNSDMKLMLNSQVQTLINNPRLIIEVAGYADSRGSINYNRRLSERRAKAVRNYLIAQGVSAERLKVEGYGESTPAAENNTREGRAQNRRVVLRIINSTL